MKNYVKEGQKLPLYGVGPMIAFGMGTVTAIGISSKCSFDSLKYGSMAPHIKTEQVRNQSNPAQ